MLKTHKQRAPFRRRKRWGKKRSQRETVQITYYTEPELGPVSSTDAFTESAVASMYAVMVKLIDKTRAERLTMTGGTTTRKANAASFYSRETAEQTAVTVSGRNDVERAWVTRS